MKRLPNSQQAVTLLEMLIVSFLLVIAATISFRALGQGRILRAAARERTQMVLLAQSELDRLFLLPEADLPWGTQVQRELPGQPAMLELETTVVAFAANTETTPSSETLLLQVAVRRPTREGLPDVRLSTLRLMEEAP